MTTYPENTVLYTERYCAFIDILGFREIVSALDRDTFSAGDLIALLNEVHQPSRGVKSLQEVDLRVQSISDAVAISAAPTGEGLGQLFLASDVLTINLLKRGFFVRGAIAKGRLYHDKNMIFGDALVRAYHFESQIARYARLLVTSSVKYDIDQYAVKDAQLFEDRILQADDGPYYSNSLRDLAVAASLIDGDRFATTVVGDDLILMRDNIQKRLQEAVDNPSHFEKVRWFAAYWNQVMPELPKLPKVQGPGLYTVLAID